MRERDERHGDDARFAQMKRHESDTRQRGRRRKEAAVEREEWQLKSSTRSRGGGSSGGEAGRVEQAAQKLQAMIERSS